jgi:hypothetical protein
MYIKSSFLNDLQRSVANDEYFINRNELCDAIVYDSKLLFDNHHVVLFDAESINEYYTNEYFIIRTENRFTLLAIASNNKNSCLLEIVEFSNFPLYSEAMQRMLDIENTDF